MVHIKILCLDQATKISGYSVFLNNELQVYGKLEVMPDEKNPIERMKKMLDMIIRLIDSDKPDFIVLEDTQFQNNYATFQQLSQLQGVIMAVLFERNIGFEIIQPTAWKSATGVKGKKRIEQKSSAIQIVKDNFQIEPTEDEADAILIGCWAVKKILKKNVVVKGVNT